MGDADDNSAAVGGSRRALFDRQVACGASSRGGGERRCREAPWPMGMMVRVNSESQGRPTQDRELVEIDGRRHRRRSLAVKRKSVSGLEQLLAEELCAGGIYWG